MKTMTQLFQKLISGFTQRRRSLKIYCYDGPSLGKTQLEPAFCNDLCRTAMLAIQDFRPKYVSLYFTSEVNDNCRIRTDSTRVVNLLTMFLRDSCSYLKKGEIHLHCSRSENPGYITFSVTDTHLRYNLLQQWMQWTEESPQPTTVEFKFRPHPIAAPPVTSLNSASI